MRRYIFILLSLVLLIAGCSARKTSEETRAFHFNMNFNYAADPVVVYDNLTGDISAWWDHTFSGNPDSLYIEAWPGGGFYEIFDESGDGVRHATVTYARRGEILRMEGPLGLSGQALKLVCTYTLQRTKDGGTLLSLDVKGAGSFPEETAGIVESVWEHFLWEQFRPYIQRKMDAAEGPQP